MSDHRGRVWNRRSPGDPFQHPTSTHNAIIRRVNPVMEYFDGTSRLTTRLPLGRLVAASWIVDMDTLLHRIAAAIGCLDVCELSSLAH